MLECHLFSISLSALIRLLLEVKNIIATLRANKDLSVYGRGSWALITARTDGIGQGFAVSLATQGFNIIQVGTVDLLTVALHTSKASLRTVLLH